MSLHTAERPMSTSLAAEEIVGWNNFYPNELEIDGKPATLSEVARRGLGHIVSSHPRIPEQRVPRPEDSLPGEFLG